MIDIKNLEVDYFGKIAIEGVNLSIPFGYSIGIIGPNGAGKSTLMKSMLGVIDKKSGTVLYNNTDIKQKLRKIAYVPQKTDVDLTFPITVFDAILTGTYPNVPLFKRPGKKERDTAKQAMDLVQISDLKDKQISNLSGGQLQRVFIARALAQNPDVFFLDEPFSGIDLVSEQIIIDLLRDLEKDGKTILVVHHDLHAVESYFDKLIILNKELIAFGDVQDVFTTENIKKAYGQSLGNIEVKGLGAVL